MGIRFHCYHCERQLNVKAKQAGQFCLCPACANEIQIPLESETRKTKRRRQPNANSTASVSPLMANSLELQRKPTNQVSLAPSAENTSPQGSEPMLRDSSEVPDSFASDDPAASPPAAEINPIPDDSNSFMLSKPVIKLEDDPLRADPNKIWYVRHKRHGEKGPLKAQALEEMIDNGSIRVGHIVWREDWNEWLPAAKVFQQVAERHQQALTDASCEIPDDVNPPAKVKRIARKRRLIWLSLAIMAFLTVIVLVYWIFSRYN